MAMNAPYRHSPLARYLAKRVFELSAHKTQADIAREAGFRSANILSMMKSGETKLPLDRVPALARALAADPRLLLRMALQQIGLEGTRDAMDEIIGTVLSANELGWIQAIREISNDRDPVLTDQLRIHLETIMRAPH